MASDNEENLGSRRDPGWEHGTLIDKAKGKVKCKYCARETSGGVYRLKQHLAGGYPVVAKCKKCPVEVREHMKKCLALLKKKKKELRQERRDIEDLDNSDDSDHDDDDSLNKKRNNVKIGPMDLFVSKKVCTLFHILITKFDSCT